MKNLHHVRFLVRDLDTQEKFANDFGLVTEQRTDNRLVMRTRGQNTVAYVACKGDQDAFVGAAFETDDEAVLDKAVSAHGATPADLANVPGVERAVALTDPDGNQILIVHGVKKRPPDKLYPDLILNTPLTKVRKGRKQMQRDRGPARLWKLGHVVLLVRSFAASVAWYEEKLGVMASDILIENTAPDLR